MTEVEPVAQQPFALGVLFVHGMGSHAPGSTLREFAEPLVGWMKTAHVGIDEVHLERTRLDGAGDAPAHVTCVLKSSADEASTWLLAETCWSESFEPPSYLKISFWLIASVPWMLGDYMRAAIMRENERATLRFLRPFRWLLIVLYAALGALLAGPIVLLLPRCSSGS